MTALRHSAKALDNEGDWKLLNQKGQTENLPGSERRNQGIYSGKNLWSTGKMEAFGQRDGAHGPGIYRG